jgi:hypothetical protein
MGNMRRLLVGILLFSGIMLPRWTWAGSGDGETTGASNALFFEVGGQGILYSVNYDRLLGPHASVHAGYTPFGGGEYVLPAGISYLSSGNHRLELGAGLSYLNVHESEFSIGIRRGLFGTAVFGYRYQPREGGFMFRVGFTPLIGAFANTRIGPVLPWFGLSTGYCF